MPLSRWKFEPSMPGGQGKFIVLTSPASWRWSRFPLVNPSVALNHHAILAVQDEEQWCMALMRSRLP
jgi:hypothetical protein